MLMYRFDDTLIEATMDNNLGIDQMTSAVERWRVTITNIFTGASETIRMSDVEMQALMGLTFTFDEPGYSPEVDGFEQWARQKLAHKVPVTVRPYP